MHEQQDGDAGGSRSKEEVPGQETTPAQRMPESAAKSDVVHADAKSAVPKTSATLPAVSSSALTPMDAVDERLVNDAVEFINTAHNDATEQFGRAIAHYVLKTFFNNSIELARSKKPNKGASYNALCRHPDLMVSKSTLSNYVNVEIQRDFLERNDIDVAELSYSHQAALIRLPDGRAKIDLAKKAIDGNVRVKDLKELVSRTKPQIAHQQPLIPDLAGDYAKNPLRLTDDPQKMEFVTDAEKLKKISPKKREHFREKLIAGRERAADSVAKLEFILTTLDIVDSPESDDRLQNHEPVDVAFRHVSTSVPEKTPQESVSIRQAPAPEPYELIIAYIPWEQVGSGDANAPTLEDVTRIAIPEVAAKDCVLWLRATNQRLPDAYSVLAKWGFVPQTVLTWVKPHAQPAEWLHDKTEHFVMATKGSPRLNSDLKFNSAMTAAAKTGSRVPVGFYELIEGVYDAEKRLHVFPSIERDGWQSWAPWDVPEVAEEVQREESAAKGSHEKGGKKKGKKAAGTKKGKAEATSDGA